MEIEDMSDIIADERPTSALVSATPLTTSSASAVFDNFSLYPGRISHAMPCV